MEDTSVAPRFEEYLGSTSGCLTQFSLLGFLSICSDTVFNEGE